MFNIGINEEQTLADGMRLTFPQAQINCESAKRLAEYYQAVNNHDWLSKPSAFKLLNLLDACPQNPTEKKNILVHELAQEIARELNGVRFVQCKSAKDRTSMAVSLEQVRIMKEIGLVPNDKEFEFYLEQMRRDGLGLLRCYKNTGNMAYAFNKVQMMTFPKIFKAPKGTYKTNIET